MCIEIIILEILDSLAEIHNISLRLEKCVFQHEKRICVPSRGLVVFRNEFNPLKPQYPHTNSPN